MKLYKVVVREEGKPDRVFGENLTLTDAVQLCFAVESPGWPKRQWGDIHAQDREDGGPRPEYESDQHGFR